jgi:hypothetical protein
MSLKSTVEGKVELGTQSFSQAVVRENTNLKIAYF